MYPRTAALDVDQRTINGKSDATGDSEERINLVAAVQQPLNAAGAVTRKIGRAPLKFSAQHPPAELIIEADLAATEEAIHGMGAFETEQAGGSTPATAATGGRDNGDASWISR